MDLNKILSLYHEGQAYVKRCRDLCDEIPGLVGINPYYGYILLDKEEFVDLVKDPDTIHSSQLTMGREWNHEAVVNGVTFACITEGEDLYGN